MSKEISNNIQMILDSENKNSMSKRVFAKKNIV